jgi:hypothetical protein
MFDFLMLIKKPHLNRDEVILIKYTIFIYYLANIQHFLFQLLSDNPEWVFQT